MLVIRMQRTGRKGHAQFRVVVQDSRRTPTSGKVVAALGHFNPHTKETSLDKEKASLYISNGAQPSERVIRLLQQEGVKLPSWVTPSAGKARTIRNPEKRRSTSPAKPEEPSEAAAEPAADPTPEEKVSPEAEEVPATEPEAVAADEPETP